MSDPVIAHGSIHKVNVVKGKIAKCVQDTTSRLLGEGEHTIESTDFQVVGFEDIMKSHCIQHGKFYVDSLYSVPCFLLSAPLFCLLTR